MLKVAGCLSTLGQGDLNDRANYYHQAQRIRQKGATHFYCHPNLNEYDQLDEGLICFITTNKKRIYSCQNIKLNKPEERFK